MTNVINPAMMSAPNIRTPKAFRLRSRRHGESSCTPCTATLHESLLNSALFVPNGLTAERTTFLAVNAAVAETRAEAMALILPNLAPLAEEAQRAELTPQQQRKRAVLSPLSRG